jgi:DNA-binding MarR family transcriptional regulator
LTVWWRDRHNDPEKDKGTMDATDRKQMTSAELSNRLFFRLYQCANMMHKTGTRALDRHGVTTQQWAVLGALSRDSARNGMSVGDLAEFLLVSRQNLTGVLARLEKQGHLERAKDQTDGRSRRIRLTTEGRRLWESELIPMIFDYYEDALSDFSINDKVNIVHYLNKLLDNLKRVDKEASS